MASAKPSPSSPSRLAAGMRQVSKPSSASTSKAMTFIWRVTEKPGRSASTRKALSPRAERASPVRAKTV